MRKLASIQKISATEPIQDADAIEKATVLGWQLVVKKGEFKPGDLCVYCEIDSVLPERSEFEFLKPRKMRIKTVKLRGQISQGICFPLSILPTDTEIREDMDVTEILGIIKYEPPIPAHLQGVAKGKIPSFIPKTDEPRVQVVQDTLDSFKGEKCYITEKLDGSSVTYYINEGTFGVCSRNLELLETDENTLWKVAKDLDIENKLRSLNGNYAVQGEMVGEGIQKNTLKLRGQTVYVFNLYDIDNHKYSDFQQFYDTINNLGLETVPLINKDFVLFVDINKLVEISIGNSLINPETMREGIVIRPLEEKYDKNGRVSFKVVNPKYLLKYE
ncbi:MAG: RNA ligase (ATP) [Cytophagales bacterium]|nr:RNA ligase (ATP) [Cytophagales bacterium]